MIAVGEYRSTRTGAEQGFKKDFPTTVVCPQYSETWERIIFASKTNAARQAAPTVNGGVDYLVPIH